LSIFVRVRCCNGRESLRKVTKNAMYELVHGQDFHSVLPEQVRERDHWGDPDVDGRIILR